MTPEDLVSDIEAHSDKLNDWEKKFVSDIAGKLQKGWALSEKQIAKLEAIHQDYVE